MPGPSGASYKPWRVTACLERDHLPPVFCNYLMDDLRTTCDPEDGRAFTAENMESYTCSETCAQSLMTVHHHCQTSWYLRVKEWSPEAKAAFGVLVRPSPAGPCRQTFRSMTSVRLVELEADPECGSLYDECVADGWCLYNLREAVEALQMPFLVEGFEDRLCNPDKSKAFQRLYQCIDRQTDGPRGWTRASCAAPDVLAPGQCAVVLDAFNPDGTHQACEMPAGGWNVPAVSAYTCSVECASTLVTAVSQCQTSFWHYTDAWSEEGRATLAALVDPDPEYPGPCRTTFGDRVDTIMSGLREDATCGPKYRRCMLDYGCRTELREGLTATMTRPAKMNFESAICGKSWQIQELYECSEQIRPAAVAGPPMPRWQQSRCWERDLLPPPICESIFAETGAACAIGGVPWFGQGALTLETAESFQCPVDCARSIIDAWKYCQTSFGTYETATMTAEQRTVWYTLIDWDEDSPGPCMATFRGHVREVVAAIAQGPCELAYNNCVGGQNQGWCTANLRDAIGSLQSEYARESFEAKMCSKSRDFQWLYQCVRENGVEAAGLGAAGVIAPAPWRASVCAAPDKLTRVQCANLIGGGGIATACPDPAGGWSPASARAYDCSSDCARMLFAAVNECQATFAAYVDTWPMVNKFSLLMLLAPGPTYTGSCTTTRRERVGAILGRVAADPDCGPKYDACFRSDSCRENIREGFESLGFAPSRVLFESTVCSRPVAYQQLHECTSTKYAIFVDNAREAGDWSRAWRRTSCLAPDQIPPYFCGGVLDNLNSTCPPPESGVFDAASAAEYACSDDCAKSLTTAWNYCQTSFYLREQSWSVGGQEYLRGLVSGAPDLPAEGSKGPCTLVQEELVIETLAAVESDPDCGRLYDECVVDGWCLFNMKAAVPALQSEYVRPAFEAKLCSTEWSTPFQRLYECVDRKRQGPAGWTRAACAQPDTLTPSQCAVILEAFDDGSTHPACQEPVGGWTLAAMNSQAIPYLCSDECANQLTTVFKYCQTSWFTLVMSNTNGWDEQGREVLRAMISDDPEYPGPCAVSHGLQLQSLWRIPMENPYCSCKLTRVRSQVTRTNTIAAEFDMIRADSVCGPKYFTCMGDYDCRVELGDAVGASLMPWSRTRYEGEMCSRTWQMQELYQCYRAMTTTGPRAWTRSRCLIDDKAAPPICSAVFAQIQADCPDIDRLTVEQAAAADCSDDCARTITTAYSWCQTSYAALIAAQPEAQRAVIWTLINWDEDEPGPCFVKFRDLVGASMRALETGPCRSAYNNCVGGQHRDQCLPELREAIGALQTRSANARTTFEATICQKSRSFQWLYTCARHADDTVPAAEAWSTTACAPADVLSPVQCGSLIAGFRDRSACPLPRSGVWNPESARSYTCSPGCAASLMTAFYECPTSFGRLIDADSTRASRLALFTLTQVRTASKGRLLCG